MFIGSEGGDACLFGKGAGERGSSKNRPGWSKRYEGGQKGGRGAADKAGQGLLMAGQTGTGGTEWLWPNEQEPELARRGEEEPPDTGGRRRGGEGVPEVAGSTAPIEAVRLPRGGSWTVVKNAV